MRRPHKLVIALSAIFAIAAVPATAGASSCPGAELRPAQDNIPQVSQATLCLINAERAANGLPALSEQAQLTSASLAFSQLMVDLRFFAHVAPDGTVLTARLQASGYLSQPGGWTVGENIAWGESYLGTPESIVLAWMNSPPHRENILSPDFSEIGVGIVTGVPTTTSPGATYTTDFGDRTADPDVSSDFEDVDVIDDEDESAQTSRQPSTSKSRKSGPTRKRARRKSSRRSSRSTRRNRKVRRSGGKMRPLAMRAIRTTSAVAD